VTLLETRQKDEEEIEKQNAPFGRPIIPPNSVWNANLEVFGRGGEVEGLRI
jgi:hypothetical protein